MYPEMLIINISVCTVQEISILAWIHKNKDVRPVSALFFGGIEAPQK